MLKALAQVAALCLVAFPVATHCMAQYPVRVEPKALRNPSRSMTTINVNHAYQSLQFRGRVQRVDLGSEYEFRSHIAVTFRPTADHPVADLRMCQLGVTQFRTSSRQRHVVLHRETQSIAVLLKKAGERKRLPDLVFRLPKSVAMQATHIGLAVSDGRLLWPIPTELK